MTKVLNGCNNFFNVYQLQAYLKMSRQLLFSKYSVNFFKMGLGYVFKDPVILSFLL